MNIISTNKIDQIDSDNICELLYNKHTAIYHMIYDDIASENKGNNIGSVLETLNNICNTKYNINDKKFSEQMDSFKVVIDKIKICNEKFAVIRQMIYSITDANIYDKQLNEHSYGIKLAKINNPYNEKKKKSWIFLLIC